MVTLLDSEQLVCRTLATARHQANRDSSIPNRRIGPQTDAFTDLNGIGGEFAFCKMFNLWFDFSVHPRGLGWDCMARQPIDVKTTARPDGALLVPVHKATVQESGVFVLMIGAFPGPYRFAGWARSADVFHPARLGSKGYGPVYIVPQQDLRTRTAFQPLSHLPVIQGCVA